MSHENGIGTKITSTKPLNENGNLKTLSFGDSTNYSSTNIIGTFLNGEYLNNYLTEENRNMIEDNTTWYLGAVADGVNYIFAKYKNTNMSEYATNTKAKVGLLRMGELMSGQFDAYENSSDYWLLTPFSQFPERIVDKSSYAGFNSPAATYAIKPSFNLKENIIITSGTGTKEDPFILSVQ